MSAKYNILQQKVHRSGHTPRGGMQALSPPLAAALACNYCSVADWGKMENTGAPQWAHSG